MERQRKVVRLREYDYSQAGGYFVAICTYNREHLFGEVVGGEMRLNKYGRIAEREWLESENIRKEILLDAFVIMPNHLHGIIIICEDNVGANGVVGANGRSPLQISMRPRSLSSFIAGYKSAVTKRINILRNAPGTPVWQRNYYEHIVRNESELNRVREYVINNPQNWELDRENPLSKNFELKHDLYWGKIYEER